MSIGGRLDGKLPTTDYSINKRFRHIAGKAFASKLPLAQIRCP